MSNDTRYRNVALVCFALLLAGLALFFFAGCASSRTGKALSVAVIGSASADLVSTRMAINSGNGVEGNPAMGQQFWQQAVVKSFGVGTVIGAAALVEIKGRPILARIVQGVAIAAWAGASWHNFNISKGAR